MISKDTLLKYIITIISHSIFWIAIYYFYAYFLGYGSSNVAYVNLFSGFLMPVTILISYFLIYYLIPNYLLTKKYKYFILYSVYAFILSVYVIILSILYGLIYSEAYKEVGTAPLTKTLPFIILGVYFVVLIVVSLSLIVHNYNSIVKNENLNNKILNAQLELKEQELKFLKMQIHPHFLFNSLNTIYGFALKKGDEAPEMILKLSNLLDYILYQVEKPSVLLQDEVNHLLDYVSLEKMRFHDTLEVKIEREIENENSQITPMILIPFVENAFKHGAIVKGKLRVTMLLKTKGDKLFFEIMNTSIKDTNFEKGIGLENIKKRLEMLYPNAHNIEIEQRENSFTVKLTIRNLNILNNEQNL
ncbi:MAG: histidine kinase [Lutibacter sp.]|uniref:sensor histidine kinase n=1 Tax=Lutibacter sp. TaxID=1925666 RepID=UPI00179E5426|nr:histidine kinase [Lutibacter sp.]MBT8316933.1 histidine kinase [Lutibacter sp.]NNJ57793.1 histidine kinase [Lutibacter sp.]